MERKIGEIFEFGGEWYQCVEGNCAYCSIQDEACEQRIINDVCRLNRIFKKLEKAGEPIEFARGLYFQRYQLADLTAFYEGDTRLFFNAPTKTLVYIEIKTKEDMEEKNNAKHSNSEKIGKNLKEFDLEAAKSGKPVCTRDGHKARIICFDYNGETGDYPIVALVHYNKGNKCYERVLKYTSDGLFNKYGDCQHDDDLMMLPEKKEGWVNVYKDSVYDTKDDALIGRSEIRGYIDTIKISWEE